LREQQKTNAPPREGKAKEKKMQVRTPGDVYNFLKNRFGGKRQEHFLCLTLNGAHEVIKSHVVTIGILNRTIVHPREVFYRAIKDNAAAIIIAHNHPSGRTVPSPEDEELTRRLKEAGEIMGIPILEHLIITKKNGYYSFREHGTL
jgi:DNA repair protein RadC